MSMKTKEAGIQDAELTTRHSRAGGNPVRKAPSSEGLRSGFAFAGMTSGLGRPYCSNDTSTMDGRSLTLLLALN